MALHSGRRHQPQSSEKDQIKAVPAGSLIRMRAIALRGRLGYRSSREADEQPRCGPGSLSDDESRSLAATLPLVTPTRVEGLRRLPTVVNRSGRRQSPDLGEHELSNSEHTLNSPDDSAGYSGHPTVTARGCGSTPSRPPFGSGLPAPGRSLRHHPALSHGPLPAPSARPGCPTGRAPGRSAGAQARHRHLHPIRATAVPHVRRQAPCLSQAPPSLRTRGTGHIAGSERAG
ncbi:MAG: hypothetical protein JWQ95_2483 [Sphaerisporangium sp.]|nr:hypothetical protein [Sphaerisporangium sp.]